MSYKRRDFLKTAAAGAAIALVNGKSFGHDFFDGQPIKNFGLQLYTLRDVIGDDPKGILKKVTDMGYKQIESYEGKMGMFWGMKNTEFKKYMDELGMTIISSHCDINKDFERKADEAAEIGMKYLICPSMDNEKGMNKEACKKAADLFNSKGKICKAKGIRFAYHNHDGPFAKREGNLILEEALLQNTDADLVDFEMDIYWVVTAGEDPIKWLKKYPNRFKLCHLKDRKKDAPLSEREVSVTLGKGGTDFKKILKTAKEYGMKYYIVEQEKYEGTTPIQAAEDDATYIKKLRV